MILKRPSIVCNGLARGQAGNSAAGTNQNQRARFRTGLDPADAL
jgi:hypothetical protein